MRYVMLIYENEQQWTSLTPAEQGQMFMEYGAVIEPLRAQGKYITGAPLEPTTTATTVRVRNGQVEATDGPFAETREQLGGFMLVEAKDLDEALAIAARVPSARHGSIEVRPVQEIPADILAARAAKAGVA